MVSARQGFVVLVLVVGMLAASAGSAGAIPVRAPSPVAAAPPPQPISWQSAGDSFSSGEGVFGNEGPCAQSPEAFGPAAAQTLKGRGWKFSSNTFTACTGHLAEQYLASVDGKPSLWDWGKEQNGPDRVDVITMSFGGNDIGFADILTSCLLQTIVAGVGWLPGTPKVTQFPGECNDPEQALKTRVDRLLDPTKDCTKTPRDSTDCKLDLGSRRGSIIDFYYDVVMNKLTAQGQLYVVGYPQLFAPVADWPVWSKAMCHGVTRGDAQKTTNVSNHLNTRLREAVDRANQALPTQRVFYVDRLAAYADGGHDLCGPGEDWLNGLATYRDAGGGIRKEMSFHPNAEGHYNITKVLTALIEENFPGKTAAKPEAPGPDVATFCSEIPTRGENTEVWAHDIDCVQALDIARRYFDPSTVIEGSSGHGQVDDWYCYTDTNPTPTGALGECAWDDGSHLIEFLPPLGGANEPPDELGLFLGTWAQHAGSLTIREDRTITMSSQMYPEGATGPTFPLVALKVISATSGVLTAEVTQSDTPSVVPLGQRFTFTPTGYGLKMTGNEAAGSSWCDDASMLEGVCGA